MTDTSPPEIPSHPTWSRLENDAYLAHEVMWNQFGPDKVKLITIRLGSHWHAFVMAEPPGQRLRRTGTATLEIRTEFGPLRLVHDPTLPRRGYQIVLDLGEIV